MFSFSVLFLILLAYVNNLIFLDFLSTITTLVLTQHDQSSFGIRLSPHIFRDMDTALERRIVRHHDFGEEEVDLPSAELRIHGGSICELGRHIQSVL